MHVILYLDIARACRLLAMYIQEKTSPGEENVDGASVFISVVVIVHIMQEESPSGRSPVAGLYDHCHDF